MTQCQLQARNKGSADAANFFDARLKSILRFSCCCRVCEERFSFFRKKNPVEGVFLGVGGGLDLVLIGDVGWMTG